MLRVGLLFIILISGIILGPLIAGHQGYVLIQTESYNIVTSVTGLILLTLLLVSTILLLEWLLRHLLHMATRTRRWFSGRRCTRAKQQTQAALLKLAEGDHHQVEKLLTRSADHAEQPVVNYLLAAEAAQQRGDTQSTRQYLQQATELSSEDPLPVEITRVRLQLAQGDVDAAHRGVDQLLSIAPRHPEVLRLAEQAYTRSGSAGSLLDILPAMRKLHLYDDEKLLTLERQAYIALMQQSMTEQGGVGLKSWWDQQRRKTRHDIVIQCAMIEHLLQCGDQDLAQKILLSSLKQHFDDRLLLLIPRLKSGDPGQLEKTLRQHIKQQGATPLLNAALGRLLQSHGEWQHAYDALHTSLEQHPDAENYAAIADVLDQLHRPGEAAQMRKKGLQLTLQRGSESSPSG